MIVCKCDHCSAVIDRDDGGWFGVDWTPTDDLPELNEDHEFHFCSSSCLQGWIFEREFAPSKEAT